MLHDSFFNIISSSNVSIWIIDTYYNVNKVHFCVIKDSSPEASAPRAQNLRRRKPVDFPPEADPSFGGTVTAPFDHFGIDP